MAACASCTCEQNLSKFSYLYTVNQEVTQVRVINSPNWISFISVDTSKESFVLLQCSSIYMQLMLLFIATAHPGRYHATKRSNLKSKQKLFDGRLMFTIKFVHFMVSLLFTVWTIFFSSIINTNIIITISWFQFFLFFYCSPFFF